MKINMKKMGKTGTNKIYKVRHYNSNSNPACAAGIYDVVVVGGGPAGMIAAGRAAERGLAVLLLEKNSTLGNKLLITGGGRCNLTNNKTNVREMLAKYKESGKFLFSAFTRFGVQETLDFFHERGVQTKEEAEGRVFPISDQARSVLDALKQYMKKGDVAVRTSVAVSKITFNKSSEKFTITLADESKICARACIVATGGTSHPETGSTGDGFKWLKSLGHGISKNDMALVPIALKDPWIKELAGVTLVNIKLTTFVGNEKQKAYKGKMLFTHVGISGPAVLNMSKEVGKLLPEGEVKIILDLFPTVDSGALRMKLQTLLIAQSNKKIKNVLSLLIPPALVDVVLMLAMLDGETPNHSVRKEERQELISVLKAIPLRVSGLLGKEKAIVSSGGVALTEVDTKTMRSLIIPQLYLVGDVLDIDRPSGGYSLQLCWTTGYVAGSSC
jgi:hypothetical protein